MSSPILAALSMFFWILNFVIITLFLGILILYTFNRLTCGISSSSSCLVGKTALVTGGNSGIGYQVCLNLASHGCKVIMADKEDCEESRINIIEFTGNPNISARYIDLASFKSVRTFAENLKSDQQELDILIHNAGISGMNVKADKLTEDGFNSTTQVNYLSPFLLTHLLVDLLQKKSSSNNSRIIFTSSVMAFFGYFDENMLKQTKFYGNYLSKTFIYSNSKLATIMASDIFAKKLKAKGITCNSVHPGFVRTKMIMNIYEDNVRTNVFSWVLQIVLMVMAYLAGKSIWEGSQTTTHVAISKKLEDVTGNYFWDCMPFLKPPQTNLQQLSKKLWRISEDAVGLSPEERL